MTLVRDIVKIDEEKCNGCGQCVPACAEGALRIVAGKAKLVSEIYCDGLGACLGVCPQDAITMEKREAATFDEEAVEELAAEQGAETRPFGCPGSAARMLSGDAGQPGASEPADVGDVPASKLGHWPVQLKLVPPFAPFLKNADLVVCADCVAFAVPDFHDRYVAGRAVVVGCPKLDDLAYYREKLEAIFREATPRSITVLRMEVPCCAGIANAALSSRNAAAPDAPTQVHVIGVEGRIARQMLV
jgi:ferredoxin